MLWARTGSVRWYCAAWSPKAAAGAKGACAWGSSHPDRSLQLSARPDNGGAGSWSMLPPPPTAPSPCAECPKYKRGPRRVATMVLAELSSLVEGERQHFESLAFEPDGSPVEVRHPSAPTCLSSTPAVRFCAWAGRRPLGTSGDSCGSPCNHAAS